MKLHLSKASLLLSITILLLMGSCDHTVLSGKIILVSSELKVGKKYSLYLEIPPEYKEIHSIHWEVEPPDFAAISFGACTEADRKKVSTCKKDRTAIITPLKPGKFEIAVSGFYHQTNPQPITIKKVQSVW